MSTIPLEEIEPMMLAYGKACYSAQHLEAALRFLLVLNRSNNKGQVVAPDAIGEIESETMREAVFALFNLARKFEYFTSNEEKRVKRAIWDRNFLIHELWDRNAASIATPEGRQKVLKKIEAIHSQLKSASDIINDLSNRYLAECGLSVDQIKELAMQQYTPGGNGSSDSGEA